jgi:hypothetical protein
MIRLLESTDLTTPRIEWVAVDVDFADALFAGLRLFGAVALVCAATAGTASPVIGTASIAPRTIAAVLILRIYSSLCIYRCRGIPVHLAPVTLKGREHRINFI